jgi:hypothetical protein
MLGLRRLKSAIDTAVMDAEELLCPECSFEDRGDFCSRCGAPLRVEPRNFASLLRTRLGALDYVDITNGSTTEPFNDFGPTLTALAPPPRCLLGSIAEGGSKKDALLLAIYEADTLSPQRVQQLADSATAAARGDEGNFGQAARFRLSLCICLLYSGGCSPTIITDIGELAEPVVRFPKSPAVTLLAVDVLNKGQYARGHNQYSTDISAALRQVGPAPASAAKEPRIQEELSRALWRSLSQIVATWRQFNAKPSHVASRIDRGRVGFGEALALLVASYTVGAILAKIFAVEVIEFNFLPVVDDVLRGAVALGVAFFNAVLVHKPLRMAGGSASFRHTLFGVMYASALVYPVLVLIEGLAHIVGVDPNDWRGYNTAVGGAYTSVTAGYLAPIHRLSMMRTALVVLAAVICFAVVVFLAVLLVLLLVGPVTS